MKKYIYMALAAIAVLSSCSSDIESIKDDTTGKEVRKFTAKIENSATRATYNSTEQCASWEVGDVINVDGNEYTSTQAGVVAEFTGSGAKGETHHAYFPASLFNGEKASLPATQTYTAGKFDMPMYAESTGADLYFKNLCAVLAITITSEDIASLKSIKVKSDKKLNGSFTVVDEVTDDEPNGKKALIGEDGTNQVVLEMPEALTLDEAGTTFYIAIPSQEYQYLNIFLSADGETYTLAMGTKKADGLGEIKCSNMYNINYATNAVKLWTGSVFLADRNIGASSPEDYGGYYTWGGTHKNGVGLTWVDDHYTGSGDLPAAYDTATNLWGSNWRMMTQSECSVFASYNYRGCKYEWTTLNNVSGAKITGFANTIYSANSIFLPAAGSNYEGSNDLTPGKVACYFTSTHTSGDVWMGNLLENTSGMQGWYRDEACSIRPVLDE